MSNVINLRVFLKRIIFLLAAITALSLVVVPSTATAAFEVLDPACKDFNAGDPNAPTVCQDADDPQNIDNNSIYGPNGIITKAVRLFSIVIGVAAVVMIIIGGLRYIIGLGDPNSISGAKNTILYALIGLVVAALSQALVIFVISKL